MKLLFTAYLYCYRGWVSWGTNISLWGEKWISRTQLWTKCSTASQPATTHTTACLRKGWNAGILGNF